MGEERRRVGEQREVEATQCPTGAHGPSSGVKQRVCTVKVESLPGESGDVK